MITDTAPAYVRHEKLVHHVVRKYFWWLTHCGYDYEDLVQEGLLAIWKAEKHYDPARGRESTYYARIAFNGIHKQYASPLDMQKHRGDRHLVSLDAPIPGRNNSPGKITTMLEQIPTGERDLLEQTAEKIIAQRFMKKISRKPNWVRMVKMRFEDEMTFQEIAHAVGGTTQNAKQMMNRALEAMRS